MNITHNFQSDSGSNLSDKELADKASVFKYGMFEKIILFKPKDVNERLFSLSLAHIFTMSEMSETEVSVDYQSKQIIYKTGENFLKAADDTIRGNILICYGLVIVYLGSGLALFVVKPSALWLCITCSAFIPLCIWFLQCRKHVRYGKIVKESYLTMARLDKEVTTSNSPGESQEP